ncbi:MAG: shikimate dehydrogenase [Sphingobium sp.]
MGETVTLQLDGETRLFGIIGDPIAQTLSPQSVTPLMVAMGANAVLVPLHVPAGRLEEVMRGLMALRNFHGAMVTYPFKAEAMALLDTVRPTGKLVGAVNAIRREADGSWSGDIFDGRGLVAGMEKEGLSPRGLDILLLGGGGAGSAIALALAEAGAARLTVFDVDGARAAALADTVGQAFPDCATRSGPADPAGCDLIVNATPMGMQPGDPTPLDVALLKSGMTVFDIVPKPDVPLVTAARAAGCRTIDYRAMAHGQYAAIARFFTGR